MMSSNNENRPSGTTDMPVLEESSLYLSDFLTGLIAVLTKKGVSTLSRRDQRFDQAVAAMQDDLQKVAGEHHLEVRFKILPHAVHADSTALSEALYLAAKREIVSFDNPEFLDVRLIMTAEEAEQYLRRVPGTKKMYEDLAQLFLARYRETVQSSDQV